MKTTTSKKTTIKKGFDLESWNVSNPNRVPTHAINDRFNPTARVAVNQYNVNNPGLLDDTYQWLIGTTNEVTNVTGHFTCWVPSGTGIEYRQQTGYNRMDYRSKKYFCHRFVWLYHNPGKSVAGGYDISHLCGNSSCCRYTHLLCEPKPDNIARINCVGYLVSVYDNTDILKICTHNTPCKKAMYIDNNNVVVTIVNAD